MRSCLNHIPLNRTSLSLAQGFTTSRPAGTRPLSKVPEFRAEGASSEFLIFAPNRASWGHLTALAGIAERAVPQRVSPSDLCFSPSRRALHGLTR
jgi:hypothetical protein